MLHLLTQQRGEVSQEEPELLRAWSDPSLPEAGFSQDSMRVRTQSYPLCPVFFHRNNTELPEPTSQCPCLIWLLLGILNILLHFCFQHSTRQALAVPPWRKPAFYREVNCGTAEGLSLLRAWLQTMDRLRPDPHPQRMTHSRRRAPGLPQKVPGGISCDRHLRELDGGIRVDRERHRVNRAGVGGRGKPRGGVWMQVCHCWLLYGPRPPLHGMLTAP